MNEIAIGIVGYGKIAHDQHVPALAATEGLELVAVADPVLRHESLPSYSSLEAMLEAQPEIEAVALCVPPGARSVAALTAIHARKHVLLEKPPTSNLADAMELEALARKIGVTLFAAWHSKFGAAVPEAREWLVNKDIRSVRITWKEDVRIWHPGQAWIWQEGGFGVFDPGINALSILTAILPGELKLVDAELFVPSNCATPIAANLSIVARGSVPVSAEFDFRQTGLQSWDIDIETEQGSLGLLLGGNRLEIDNVSRDVSMEGEYPALYGRFHALIRDGKSEVDLVPLRIVDDAMTCGSVVEVEPFEE